MLPTAEYKNENEILVKFPYNQVTLTRFKEGMPLRTWSPEDKGWLTHPDYLPLVGDLFPGLQIDDECRKHWVSIDWVKKHSRLDDDFADADDMGGTLMPFQEAGVTFIEGRRGRCIVGDEMGLGKTVQAAAYIHRHPESRPAIVVCPASVKLNWQRELEEWIKPTPVVRVLNGTKGHILSKSDTDIFVMNYEIMAGWKPYLLDLSPQVLIYDEAHYLKSPKSNRSKAAKQLSEVIPYVLLLTGTPMINRPDELWNLLNTVQPAKYPNFFSFAHRYCAAKQKPIYVKGGRRKTVWDFSGASNIPELANDLRTVMLRRTKAEVLKDLPAKTRSLVPIHMPRATYLKAVEAVEDELVEAHGEVLVAVAIEKLKQEVANFKIKKAIEWIEDFLESDQSLVVFFTHRIIGKKLHEHFKKQSVIVMGDTPQWARQEYVDQFQAGKVRLFLGNVKAAGVGLTLTAASNVAFLELGWTPGEMVQAEDRVHRIGQKDAVNAWYLMCENTIEDWLFKKLESKSRILSAVLEGEQVDTVFDKATLLREAKEFILNDKRS